MSEWIAEAKKQNINLSGLYQDKKAIYEILEKMQLPHGKSYIIKTEEINSKKIENLFEKAQYFCRLIPKDKDMIRPYKLKINSAKEFRDFCKEYDLKKYTIQLVEKGEVTYFGVIIATNDEKDNLGVCIIELVEGDGPDLTHGEKIPITAKINKNHELEWISDKKPTEEERKIIERAVEYIGGAEKPFSGYYEFTVWGKEKIIFQNYQDPETPYCNIKKI